MLSVTKPDGSAATTADFFAGGVKINGAALQRPARTPTFSMSPMI
ncbi:MAG: hypothetical protein WDO24_29955 [Pseudomonadota bacterium]